MPLLYRCMEEESFDAKAIRKGLTPRLSRLELSKKMGISYSYLRALEQGHEKWPAQRKAKFEEVIEAWKQAPSPTPRKPRSDAGKKRSELAKRRRRMRQHFPAPMVPVPVPHEHGELVGIG